MGYDDIYVCLGYWVEPYIVWCMADMNTPGSGCLKISQIIPVIGMHGELRLMTNSYAIYFVNLALNSRAF